MTFRFLSPALVEVIEAAEYYDEKIPGLGADFVFELDAAINQILKYPEAWGRISGDFRHCNFRRFPYTVIYSLEKGGRDHHRICLPSASRTTHLETKRHRNRTRRI